MNVTRTTAPADEPLTLKQAKAHLRVDDDDHSEDDLIMEYVKAAREWCENHQGRSYITQSWTRTLDEFPASDGAILLPYPPVQSITSITYTDTDGNEATMDSGDYRLLTSSLPPRVVLAYGASWPSTRDEEAAVTVEYEAGYGDAGSSVPALMKHAIRVVLGDFYEHRETGIVGTVSATVNAVAAERLLSQDRVIVVKEMEE